MNDIRIIAKLWDGIDQNTRKEIRYVCYKAGNLIRNNY